MFVLLISSRKILFPLHFINQTCHCLYKMAENSSKHYQLGHVKRKSAFEASAESGQCKPRSDCAFTQSDLGLHYPLTESIDTAECYEWRANALMRLYMHRMCLNLCILCKFEDTFLLDLTQLL